MTSTRAHRPAVATRSPPRRRSHDLHTASARGRRRLRDRARPRPARPRAARIPPPLAPHPPGTSSDAARPPQVVGHHRTRLPAPMRSCLLAAAVRPAPAARLRLRGRRSPAHSGAQSAQSTSWFLLSSLLFVVFISSPISNLHLTSPLSE
jgi:hypothetical protein